MQYWLASQRDEAVTVEGLGVLPPAAQEGPSVTVVGEVAAEHFRLARGLTLAQAKLPDGVEVAVVLDDVAGEE